MARVLIVGDTHAPSVHPGYLAFCRDLQEAWGCERVVHIGDTVDHNSISFHANHPDMPGPKDEYEQAYAAIRPWVDAFPDATVCIGNHDRRVIRLAQSVNIPARFIRDYADVWDTPGWEWVESIEIDGVYYSHGEGCSGTHPAYTKALSAMVPCAIGHCHTAFGVSWMAGPNRRIYGLSVGCGVDDDSLAFAYGKHFKKKSVLGAAVVIDGHPYSEAMLCGPGEKYHKSRFKKRVKR